MLRLLDQVPVIRALGGVAISSMSSKGGGPTPSLPGEWIRQTLPPRSAALIRDYVRHVGGDPAWYRGRVPAHLFPQWGFPLAARAIAGTSYPMARVVNAGCRIEQRAPLPPGEPLEVAARLESVDDDGRRAILTTTIITGTKSAPEALFAELRAHVPLGRPGDKNGSATGSQKEKPNKAPKRRPSVPVVAREIAFMRIGRHAGWDFAKLTGDINPLHWVPPYARAAGFRSVILHGFSTLARAIEAVDRDVLCGDVDALAVVEARFTRPLLLPASVGVYVTRDQGLYVGDAPGGGAYLEGHFETRTTAHTQDSNHG